MQEVRFPVTHRVEENPKPVIHRAYPYDGDGWICYRPCDDGGPLMFGSTPSRAYAFWQWAIKVRRLIAPAAVVALPFEAGTVRLG